MFNASVQFKLLTNPLLSKVLDNSETFGNWIVTQRGNPFSGLKKLSLFRYIQTAVATNPEHIRVVELKENSITATIIILVKTMIYIIYWKSLLYIIDEVERNLAAFVYNVQVILNI